MRTKRERSEELARGTRCNNEFFFAIDSERKEAYPCRQEQPVIRQRTRETVSIVEGLVGKSQRFSQGVDVVVFIHVAGGDQHTLRADANLARAMLDGGDEMGRQSTAHAVQFWKGALAPRSSASDAIRRRRSRQHEYGRVITIRRPADLGAAPVRAVLRPIRHQPNPNAQLRATGARRKGVRYCVPV